MRLLLTGAGGLLGSNLAPILARQHDLSMVTLTSEVQVQGGVLYHSDLSDQNAVRTLLDELRPDAIIHCAALTNVDLCEEQPELAVRHNVDSTRHLASWTAENGAYMVQISTDGVFDGITGGYREVDPPSPVNWYATTKLMAEEAVLRAKAGVILRTNIFGRHPYRPGGLADWVVETARTKGELRLFSDSVFNPMLVTDIAPVLEAVLERRLVGLMHIGTGGPMSKEEFGRQLLAQLGIKALIHPIRTSDFPFKAPRPRNTWLGTEYFGSTLGAKLLPDFGEAISRLARMYISGAREDA